MPQFRHLIFDLDGTLVDSKADLAMATNAMLLTLGLPPLSLVQVTGLIGNGARVLVEKALGEVNHHLFEQGFTLFMRYYSAHLLEETRLYDGLTSLLADVYAHGVCLSILTNKPETPSRAILGGLGLASFFTVIVGGDTLPTKKPDPQGVSYLQHRTGIQLSETLLVGDSRIDYETGVAAGIAVCGVTWGFGAQDLTVLRPQFLVDTPEQLRALVLP
jgi:phosphoglycolate phosphatase